jgi:flagellin-like hook-associated protein FlgL
MALSVTTNLAAMRTGNTLSRTDSAMTRSLQRLSSGYRISRSADDASGMSISVGLRTQSSGLTIAVRNAGDGVSVLQTADGALTETQAILHRLRDLSVQAAGGGALDTVSMGAIQSEVVQLKDQLTHIATSTEWDGTRLLDGTYNRLFQVGANVGETLPVVIGTPGKGMGADGLGLAGLDVTGTSGTLPSTVTSAVSAAEGAPAAGTVVLAGDFVDSPAYVASFTGLAGTITYDGKTLDLGTVDYSGAVTASDYIDKLNTAALAVFGTAHTPFTGSAAGLTMTGAIPGAGTTAADDQRLTPAYTGRSGAARAIALVDQAIDSVSSLRSYLGATQNRFEHTIERLQVAIENTTSSASRISDTDMAAEMSAFTALQVRSQSGVAMLSQATQTPRTILSLLN